MYFVRSKSDLFHRQIPHNYIEEVFNVIHRCL
ncbi:hypothetical protein [Xylella taiwanensis]